MSEQAITYESVLRLIQEGALASQREMEKYRLERERSAAEFDRRMAEADRETQELRRALKRTTDEVGKLGNRMGKVIERMVAGDNIIKQFQEKFGYIIDSYSRNKTFGRGLPNGNQGEIDLFLENGDIALLISVNTMFHPRYVYDHTVCIEKFRRVADIHGDKRRFIGAIAGAVIDPEAIKLAHENGLYVIVQSGKAVEILPVPEGFRAREW